MKLPIIGLVICMAFELTPVAALATCFGYAGPGGPCYAGPGGSAYAGPGGPAYAGPGGPAYAGPGGPR